MSFSHVSLALEVTVSVGRSVGWSAALVPELQKYINNY